LKNIDNYVKNVYAIVVAATEKPGIMLQILNVVLHFAKVTQELWCRCVVKARIAQVLEREPQQVMGDCGRKGHDHFDKREGPKRVWKGAVDGLHK
jgi:hypothetical protein